MEIPMFIKKITTLLESCAGDSPNFPPTLLYNEGWLLRLVLNWFSTHTVPTHTLAVSQNAHWFSEALLPSPFLPRHKGDPLAESWTHVDGVIGHFRIGDENRTGLSLLPSATQLVVLEAKLISRLSISVKNAKQYDQAARNVACITEVLRRANRHPSDLTHLGFYVVAPQAQIDKGLFRKQMGQESIRESVAQRVQAYAGAQDEWHRTWFQSVLPSIKIGVMSWEEIIHTVRESDSVAADGFEEFYRRAIAFNT